MSPKVNVPVAEGQILTERQERVLVALLNTTTLHEAAKQAGICNRTLIRWMKEPAFVARFHQIRREIVGQAIARVQASIGKAIGVLVAIATDESQPASARVSAANKLIDVGLQVNEIQELREQVAELRALLDERPAELGPGEGGEEA